MKHSYDRLNQYFWRSELPSQYLAKRERVRDDHSTTRLSPYLAIGNLSAKQVLHELNQFERRRVSNRSTRKLRQELYWRDFLRITAHLVDSHLFAVDGVQTERRPWVDDPSVVERWKRGQTGWPLVDAAMRQLNTNGYITQDSRLNVSSFLVNDLGVDWRHGAEHFAATLIDHDICSNYGNWQVVAGVAHEPMKHRRGLKQQSVRLDRSARFIKQWVPELKDLPPPTIHEMNGRNCSFETKAFGVTLGETYPTPLERART